MSTGRRALKMKEKWSYKSLKEKGNESQGRFVVDLPLILQSKNVMTCHLFKLLISVNLFSFLMSFYNE